MDADSNIPEIDALLTLLSEECTSAQVADLLRAHQREHKDVVRISAPNKKALLHSNLHTAISRGAIQLEDVCNLLREGEENGSQHIFYYVPRNETVRAKLEDHASISRSLLRKHRTSRDDLPRFILKSRKYVFADFHVSQTDKPVDLKWVAKFYGLEKYRKRAGKELHEDGLILVPFQVAEKRTVLIALYRWWGLLELRVPRIEKTSLIIEMRDTLWDKISPPLQRSKFVEWDLTKIRKYLLAHGGEHDKMYRLGSTLLMDKALGSALINLHGEDDDLLSAEARRYAVGAYVDHGARRTCNSLRVTWLAQGKRDPPTDQVVTVIGAIRKQAPKNEVIVTNKVSEGTMDYVAYRLREFQKKTP